MAAPITRRLRLAAIRLPRYTDGPMLPIKRHLPELIIFTTLLVCYAYFFPRWADWNQNSRLDQVLALVDRGVWYIDDYYQNTGDYAQFEGHLYSDKAPGTAFVGVPAYALFK